MMFATTSPRHRAATLSLAGVLTKFDVCEEAEHSDTATVTWLEDEVFPEDETAEAVPPQTVETDKGDIEIPGAPAAVVPERVGQGGCVIEYDAPGGCLPSVEISGSYIPGYTVPERQIPAGELSGGDTHEALVQEPMTVEAVETEGVRADEKCQLDEDDAVAGRVVPAVSRETITRKTLSQGAEPRRTLTESASNTDAGRIPGYGLNGYSVAGLSVSGASMPGETLSGKILEGTDGTDTAERDGEVYFTTEGDVLFDSDAHELRSGAETELSAIAEEIAEQGEGVSITVEGHTDNLATSVYDDNQDLAEQRAEAVVDWLVSNTDVPESAITAEGLGEDYPRASNDTDEGRQLNRRVVITVTPADHEPKTDIDVEDN
ncbi:OmpA family protein [Citricoccus muralis]|uniref:OmpA family protein n=1 Tax=Citricoccus muralis TaxID=169134 RepID=A0ABY8H8M8_9MICC|nr:OmpA family protein [Citricoccus muralis]WFP17513.1 OmpA family protein [Citricoccus muralis]